MQGVQAEYKRIDHRTIEIPVISSLTVIGGIK